LSKAFRCAATLKGNSMTKRPKEMDVVRRAYQLWQRAGEPSGKDDEFYFQARRELETVEDSDGAPTLGSAD
jgi:hypothetical protein